MPNEGVVYVVTLPGYIPSYLGGRQYQCRAESIEHVKQRLRGLGLRVYDVREMTIPTLDELVEIWEEGT